MNTQLIVPGRLIDTELFVLKAIKKLLAERCNASIGRIYEAHPGLSYAEVARREQRLSDVFCGGKLENCVTEPLHGSKEYCTTHNTAV